jgi:hypothetical protein
MHCEKTHFKFLCFYPVLVELLDFFPLIDFFCFICNGISGIPRYRGKETFDKIIFPTKGRHPFSKHFLFPFRFISELLCAHNLLWLDMYDACSTHGLLLINFPHLFLNERVLCVAAHHIHKWSEHHCVVKRLHTCTPERWGGAFVLQK